MSNKGSNGMDEVKDKNFKLMEEKMKNKNCKFYGSCSAPLCPMLSDEQNTNYIWYPDEDICRKRKGLPDWVRQQRKIAKKAKPENFWHYFTLDMLKVRFRVTSSVKGLDPNKPNEEAQLRAWRKRNKGSKKRRNFMEIRKPKGAFGYGQ
jgi:hypothetical protein